MRAIVVSHLYADAATRGKLRALAGLGCTIGAVAPASWQPAPGVASQATEFGNDGAVRIFPVTVRGAAPDLAWESAALKRALAEFRPDVVQVEEPASSAVAAAVLRAAGRLHFKVVIFSSDSLPSPLPFLGRVRRDRVLNRAAGAIGGNRLALALLSQGRSLQTMILPQTGVTPPLVAEPPVRPGLAIGFIGRLVPERGLDLLFRAAVRLSDSWTLHVAGTGPAQEELESLAEKLGIAARVTWHGALSRTALGALWPKLDCVALPSRTTPRWVESRGRTALEAMAHGLAVVVTASGALPEVVGAAGRVVPEEGVDQLSEALQEFARDVEGRRALGADARRRVLAEYTDAAVAERTLAFWRLVTTSASP
ncbi:MAG TPA: glycosyltransferase family 4 protein [Gemmatimonadales bacterium]|nr:glycosyltransferase family 4 protein [Gemmatimonadales bacterium]